MAKFRNDFWLIYDDAMWIYGADRTARVSSVNRHVLNLSLTDSALHEVQNASENIGLDGISVNMRGDLSEELVRVGAMVTELGEDYMYINLFGCNMILIKKFNVFQSFH